MDISRPVDVVTSGEVSQAGPPGPVGAGVVFDDALRTRLAANLQHLARIAVPLDGRRHAAVAVVVGPDDPGPPRDDPGPNNPGPASAAVLVTRRARRLHAHPGQWALPGGRVELHESAQDAARRELHEELGLDLPDSEVLGVLDDYPTRSGYVITPFVFWGGSDPVLHPNPAEVRSVHRVSFSELCRPDSPRYISIPESDRLVVQIPVGAELIHAPTGAVLLQFRRVAIEGVIERVAHCEQPLFAWR